MKSKSKSHRRIFMFGAGLHAQTCIDALERQDRYELVGFIDSVRDVGSSVDDYPVLGRLKDLAGLSEKYDVDAGFIAIGDNCARRKLHNEIVSHLPQFEFVNIIHPAAVLGKHVKIGKGVLICAQSFISSHSRLGDFCLVHQQAHLGLYNQLSDYASVSVGSILGGKVKVGTCTALTLGVVVQDRLTIGSHTVVGSGSLVLNDLPDFVVAYGSPARIIRSREAGEAYLKSS